MTSEEIGQFTILILHNSLHILRPIAGHRNVRISLTPGTVMLMDRFGARRVILASTLLYGLTLCCAFWVGSGLWQLYLLFAVVGIALDSGRAPVPYGILISHWFNRHRGLTLCLSMMGIGIGSILVPRLAQRLIATFGWRMAFPIFGAAVLLLPPPAFRF